MPTDDDSVLEQPPLTLEGDETMPVDPSNLEVALTGMANESGAASASRMRRFDQLAADSSAMWSVAQTTPTQFAALAQRTVAEAGLKIGLGLVG